MLLTGTRIFTKSPLFVAPFSYSLFYEYRDVHRCLSHWPGRPVGEGAGLMNYSVLPPEINSLRMFTGAGSAPMLAASVAWDRLAAELAVAASSFGSVTSGLAGQSWQGAAAAMAAAAAPYAGWLAAAAARAAGASAQAKAVASAFEAARAATVHPMLVAANRNAFVQLVLSNLFGQNAPAIAAAEAMYEQMWAADVAAMVGYHGGASAAAARRRWWGRWGRRCRRRPRHRRNTAGGGERIGDGFVRCTRPTRRHRPTRLAPINEGFGAGPGHGHPLSWRSGLRWCRKILPPGPLRLGQFLIATPTQEVTG